MIDPTIEEAERAIRSGRRRMLVVMVLAAVAALGGLIAFMASGDDEAVARFGRSVNGYDREHFKAFWGCMLPRADLKSLRTNEDVSRQIHLRAEENAQAYGAYLRKRCLPKLSGLSTKLRALIPPRGFDAPLEGMDRPPLSALADAAERLSGAVSDYAGYLSGLEGGYDRDMASSRVEAIVRAWYDYRVARAKLNAALKEQLGER